MQALIQFFQSRFSQRAGHLAISVLALGQAHFGAGWPDTTRASVIGAFFQNLVHTQTGILMSVWTLSHSSFLHFPNTHLLLSLPFCTCKTKPEERVKFSELYFLQSLGYSSLTFLPRTTKLECPTQFLHILFSFVTEKRGNLCRRLGEYSTPSLDG